jgi:hypothetical protein
MKPDRTGSVIEATEFKTVTLKEDGSDGAEACKKGTGRRAQGSGLRAKGHLMKIPSREGAGVGFYES